MDTRQLTFGEHLEELRGHVGRAVAYICVAMCVCLLFQETLLSVVLWPQHRVAHEGRDERLARAAQELEESLAIVRDLSAQGLLAPTTPPGATPTAVSAAAPQDVTRAAWVLERKLEAGRKLDRALATMRAGPDARVSALSPTEAFFAYLQVAFICALFVSSPLVFWELWKFAAAGLHDREMRWVRVFAPLSYGCFVGGALFGYFLLIPMSLEYLETYGSPELIMNMITLDNYLDIFLGLTFAVGLMFEVPVVAAFLAIVGVVHVQSLIAFRRYWLLAATVIAAVITPTGDPVTLAICTVPLLVLYEVGIIAVKLLEPSEKTAP